MDAKTKTTRTPRTPRTKLATLAISLVLAWASGASAGAIQIHKQAVASSRVVFLRDVANLSSDLPAFYGTLVVGRFSETETQLDVTGADIRKSLTERGENTVTLNFGGYEVCRVTHRPAQGDAQSDSTGKTEGKTSDNKPNRSVDATAAPVLSNPAEEVGLDARMTVRQRIVDWLVERMDVRPDDIEVEFDERHEAVLNAPAWRDRFVFTTTSSGLLGRLPLAISRVRDDKLVETQRVTIAVSKRQLAAVATRDLRRGDVIRATDLEIREVKLTRETGLLVGRISDVVGQVVKSSLREGRVVAMEDIEPPIFVRRNEMVQVKVVSGGLLVQTFGRALDDASLGEFVRIRNEQSKETFMARVIGKRMATLEVTAPGQK